VTAYTRILVGPCWCVYVALFGSRLLVILTTVTLASMNNALPDEGVTAPKHVGSCFNVNFNIVFKTINCASVCE